MKKYTYIFMAIVLLGTSSCFDEYDGAIDPSAPWVYFESGTVRFDEDGQGSVSTTLILSAETQQEDVVIPFTVSSSDGLEEGVDYNLSFSTLTIPAGENLVTVDILDGVIDNDVATGDRSLTIQLQDTESFIAGFPGPDKNNSSVVVTIAEDDFTIYGETSFEEVLSPLDVVRYTRAGTTEMVNNPNEPPVDFVATGDELGFDTSYAADDLDPGEDGAENLGVVTNAAISASGDTDFETVFERGTQGFVSADLDGRIEILFDEITIPTVTTLVAEMTFYANAGTTFETEDALEFFYVTEDGRGDPIMSFRGDDDTQIVTDLTGEQVQGEWITRVVEIPETQWKDGRILITMRDGADTEMFMVDYVAIKGIE